MEQQFEQTVIRDVRVDMSGRISLPAEIREDRGIQVGDTLMVESGPDGIRVKLYEDILDEIQKECAELAPGISLVDELIQDRKDEAARDE